MSETRNAKQCRTWLWAVAIVIIGLAASSWTAAAGPKDEATGTLSKAEPAIKQDGTSGHPFADAGQCPASTDLIIWPNGTAIPSIPPGISVCFVGSQSFNDNESAVQMRQR
jgi:hypothetical protein